jgi:ketosteroid isomerase-like protein
VRLEFHRSDLIGLFAAKMWKKTFRGAVFIWRAQSEETQKSFLYGRGTGKVVYFWSNQRRSGRPAGPPGANSK